jgi:hypothetical protein
MKTRKKTNNIFLLAIFIWFVALLPVSLPGYALGEDQVEQKGRIVKQKYQDAVVTVKLVLSQEMNFGGQSAPPMEFKTEVTGTVIDKSGLTIISYSSTNPGDAVSRMLKQGLFAEDGQFNIKSNLSDVKIMFPEGQECPAEVVLRDKDWDMAFVRPKEVLKQDMAFVPMDQKFSPKLLDKLVVLNRLGKVLNRASSVTLQRVSAIIEKPRTFYLLDNNNMAALGMPVFSLDGLPVGVVLLRIKESRGGAGSWSMFSGQSNMGLVPVVVPFSDIRESALQAPPVKKADQKSRGG